MPNFSPTERNDVQFLCNLQGIAGQVGDIAISAYGELLATYQQTLGVPVGVPKLPI